ncbi:septum site-determining protein MinC [Alcanivorax sp. JB21]|uniref:septum site-determining protein MinC n=1 Tax=Alcanivorax limicola TaxID=2874102 RepID=UPI001CBFD244|nr:septum site-determining protein MinC [Alcanivorax limicola]MBZ2189858.1 septum site-determining protein MinC [Alcanivorax limicola]
MTAVVEENTVLEFKGRMLMMTVLHLKTLDADVLREQLDRSLAQSPDWLREVPIVLDLPGDDVSVVALALILDLLRDRDMNLVAVAASAAVAEPEIRALGLGVVTLASARPVRADAEPAAAPVAASREPRAETLVVDQPVRSGQQLYSRGDMIVLAPVGTGAELLAEGHIHVYGNLRGRAIAGVRGDTSARVFCQQLNAELISIAGHYQVAEDLPEEFRGQAVQIGLDGEVMQFSSLRRS